MDKIVKITKIHCDNWHDDCVESVDTTCMVEWSAIIEQGPSVMTYTIELCDNSTNYSYYNNNNVHVRIYTYNLVTNLLSKFMIITT